MPGETQPQYCGCNLNVQSHWPDAVSAGSVVAPTRAPLDACRSALLAGLIRSSPNSTPNAKGYVGEASANLVKGVTMADFEADLRQGNGNELAGKFCAAHSSSALAVNVFAPFKSNVSALHLAGTSNFESLHFERKCPHGLVGRRAPNLDVVATGPEGVVAIESKCLEPLARHSADFSPAYNAGIRDARRNTAWFREMERLVAEPRAYSWLDAAQLVKHAFGLAHTFQGQPVTLVYLYWEPSNAAAYRMFIEHRAETARFAAAVEDDGPRFMAMSYRELWKAWSVQGGTDWLKRHVDRLTTRYDVAA